MDVVREDELIGRHIMKCPEDSCNGDLVVRRQRATGHLFIGCEKWPLCNHTANLPEYYRLKLLGAATLPGLEL